MQFRISGSENSTGAFAPQHIFVTLDGVVGHEDAAAPLDAPDWQELAPDLTEHPVQVDLLGQVEGSTLFPASVRTSVNSGVYRQLGLRLFSSNPRGGVAEKNVCGESGWHCVVFTDGSVQSVALPLERNVQDNGTPMLRISSHQIAGSAILVLPDTVRSYAIRVDLRSSGILSRSNTTLGRLIFSVSPE